ncbi:MAG: hypothetical protein FJ253_07010 [Phycisphaerae bacterium]|nr:hypothetical protein [Phycisphaerae bacterium]
MNATRIARAARSARSTRFAAVLVGVVLAGAALAAAGARNPPPSDRSAPTPPASGRRDAPAASSAYPSVESSMKSMNRALERLKDSIGDDSKRDANLALVDEMERAAVNAKSQPIPVKLLADAPDDATRATRKTQFRSDLILLLRQMLDLEHAVLVGRVEAAKSHLAELETLRDKAHESLGVDE